MKQLPSIFIETAVNALQFCIVTRARIDAAGGPVICCPPSFSTLLYQVIKTRLSEHDLFNDVIDDAIVTSIAIARTFSRHGVSFSLAHSDVFGYTAQQYTVALQNLFSDLPSIIADEKK